VIDLILADKFFMFTLMTIIVTRVWVYLFNKPCPTIKKFRTHHWMFELVFTAILFGISNFYTNIYIY